MLTLIEKNKDVKIVGWLSIITATIAFLASLSWMFSTSELPDDFGARTFFVLLSADSSEELAIATLILACACLISGVYILKLHKFGWWFTLLVTLVRMCDSAIDLLKHPTASIVSISMGCCLIAWLIWRRNIFWRIKVNQED